MASWYNYSGEDGGGGAGGGEPVNNTFIEPSNGGDGYASFMSITLKKADITDKLLVEHDSKRHKICHFETPTWDDEYAPNTWNIKNRLTLTTSLNNINGERSYSLSPFKINSLGYYKYHEFKDISGFKPEMKLVASKVVHENVPLNVIYSKKVDIPDDYFVLDYIEANGSQFIDTGYMSTPNTRICVDYQYFSLTVQQRVFCVPFGLRLDAYINGNGYFAFAYQNDTGNWVATNIVADTNRHTFDLDGKNKTYKIDDGLLYSTSLSGYTATNNASSSLLFFCESGANYASARFFGANIYENGILVRNFVPVQRKSDNSIGIYDTINNSFYGNSGSGTFSGAMSSITPTVTYVKEIESNSYSWDMNGKYSGIITADDNTTKYYYFILQAGGGGGGGADKTYGLFNYASGGGGGGGGGACCVRLKVHNASFYYNIDVGTGGQKGTNSNYGTVGSDGGATTLTIRYNDANGEIAGQVSVSGGLGGRGGSGNTAGNGGAGGTQTIFTNNAGILENICVVNGASGSKGCANNAGSISYSGKWSELIFTDLLNVKFSANKIFGSNGDTGSVDDRGGAGGASWLGDGGFYLDDEIIVGT